MTSSNAPVVLRTLQTPVTMKEVIASQTRSLPILFSGNVTSAIAVAPPLEALSLVVLIRAHRISVTCSASIGMILHVLAQVDVSTAAAAHLLS